MRTLDERNRLVSARRTRLFNIDITDHNGLFETRTVYDNQGRRMEYGNYDSSGNALDDTDGVALIRTTYTLYPDSIAGDRKLFRRLRPGRGREIKRRPPAPAHVRQSRLSPERSLL